MTAARAVLTAAALIVIGAALAGTTYSPDIRGPMLLGSFGVLALLAGLHRRDDGSDRS